MAEGAAGLSIVDMSNSAAFVLLNDLVSTGKLSKEDAGALKEQYEQLHTSTLDMYQEEKSSIKKAKQLNQDLLAEKIKLEKLKIRKHEESQNTGGLQKERESTARELSALMEKGSALHVQVASEERAKSELERRLEQVRRDNAELVKPEFDQAHERIRGLEEELARQELALDASKAEQETQRARDRELQQAAEDLTESKLQLKQMLNKIKADPDRIRKQADVVETATQNLAQEAEGLAGKVAACDAALEAQAARQVEVNEGGRELSRKLDLHRSTIEQRERDVDAVRKSLEQAKSAHQDLLAQRVHVELLLKEERLGLKALVHELGKARKAFEEQKKRLKKSVAAVDSIKATTPQLQANCSDMASTRNSFQSENKELVKSVAGLQQEMDVFIANYLRQESLEKDKKEALQAQVSKVKACEEQIALWIAEEHKQAHQTALLNAQREIRAREASKANQHHSSAVQELKIKELTLLDLTKKLTETNNKLRQFSALYDVVKNERNKYVNLIQASSQALAEMKEKIKILENEVEILRNESTAKDRALMKERLAHQTAQCQRDAARHDVNKSQGSHRERQNQVEQQIVEIDKLNSIINGIERAMLRLKKQYEAGVEHRNFTGVQLIDRNDELCILYEKANIQEETLKRGELGLRDKEGEIRMVRLQLAELERGLQAARRKLPDVPARAEKLLQLKQQLKQERGFTQRLCEDLETPDNDDRWRALLGEDPDVDQLQAKLHVLEHRLNGKKEQVLEKELVLEEVTELADKLTVKATDGRKQTLGLAKQVNSFQSRIKTTTRKMMAIVSELSMYQATAMKLEQEKHDWEKRVQGAQLKAANGDPPTEEAEYAWYRVERQELLAQQQQRDQQRTDAAGAAPVDPMAAAHAQATGPKKTTAPQRPNAYIPDDALGVPRPYGAQAPFKPSVPGAGMRHMRAQRPREILPL